MELTAEKQAKTYQKNELKGKPLSEIVDNGWNRLSELYGTDMRKLASQHNFKHS